MKIAKIMMATVSLFILAMCGMKLWGGKGSAPDWVYQTGAVVGLFGLVCAIFLPGGPTNPPENILDNKN